MTLGQFMECLSGKVGAIKGTNVDGTGFEEVDIEGIKDELESYGFERNGYEYLYNGMTGRKMKVMIFIGPTYYLRLKHMVADKLHGRNRGPRTQLTKQPLVIWRWNDVNHFKWVNNLLICKTSKLRGYPKRINMLYSEFLITTFIFNRIKGNWFNSQCMVTILRNIGQSAANITYSFNQNNDCVQRLYASRCEEFGKFL